jgi:hypothetical protein
VLVSLARAGTPIGILLLRTLRAWGHAAVHYSISIIRDRGIDLVALAHIAARHDPADAVFIDGWTGKGAIAAELRRSLAGRPFGFQPGPGGRRRSGRLRGLRRHQRRLSDRLRPPQRHRLGSRQPLDPEPGGVRPGDFHACVTYPHFAAQDQSRAFVDALAPLAAASRPRPIDGHAGRRGDLQAGCEAMIRHLQLAAGPLDRNRIKPGIAEATRALLRRVPDRLFVRDPADPDVAHLLHLAAKADLAVEPLPSDCSYRAVAIIRGAAATA